MSTQEKSVPNNSDFYPGYDELSMRAVVGQLRKQKQAAMDAEPPRLDEASRYRDTERLALNIMAAAGMSIDARGWQ